jgi:hypothetical protein
MNELTNLIHIYIYKEGERERKSKKWAILEHI